MSKETALYPRRKALTDEWMDLFGYWAPVTVTGTLEEYRAVRETAGLMDFTDAPSSSTSGHRAPRALPSRRSPRAK
jgi:glycine cleavage system aminomethyltransferase T